jgi:hypothetical protein
MILTRGATYMADVTKALTALALALAAAGRVLAGGVGEGEPTDPRGIVEYLEGEVLLNGVPAQIGQEVPPGAVVETAERSFCEIVFAGKNIFRIEPSSLARIEIEPERGAIELRRGALAAVFQKLQRISAGGGGFRLLTPTAVAGVRGTTFYIKVESPDSTYICTCNGQTRLADAAESFRRTVRSDGHKALRFAREADRIRALPAPLLYHDNPYMDRLAARIGVRIPWGAGGAEKGY